MIVACFCGRVFNADVGALEEVDAAFKQAPNVVQLRKIEGGGA